MREIPTLRSWHERYEDKGLVVIGNHAPEFNFDKKKANVEEAMAKLGIKYRVVMDNEFTNWDAFQNRFWPTKYLIDKKGIVRFKTIGEGNHQRTEAMIMKLLAEK